MKSERMIMKKMKKQGLCRNIRKSWHFYH